MRQKMEGVYFQFLQNKQKHYHEEGIWRLNETLELVPLLLQLRRRIQKIDIVWKNLIKSQKITIKESKLPQMRTKTLQMAKRNKNKKKKDLRFHGNRNLTMFGKPLKISLGLDFGRNR